MALNRLKVAVVGAGYVATHRHLPTMEASPLYDVVGIIDHHSGRAEEESKKRGYSFFEQTDKLEKVSWLDKVDAVTIGIKPQSHYYMIKSALDLGKHVLTEKPFAMTVEEGEGLVDLADKKGLKLGIVHNFQFSRSASRLIKDMRSGAYGKIRSITAAQLSNPKRRVPDWCEKLPLGLFYDESPHFFYLISRLSPGELEYIGSDVYPSTTGRATPSMVMGRFKCDAGQGQVIPVTLNMNFESPISEWHVFVCGDEYLGIIDIFRDIYIKLPNDGTHATLKVFRSTFLSTWQHWLQHIPRGIGHLTGKLRYGNEVVFENFAKAVMSGNEIEHINSREALKVLKLMHDVLQSSVYV